MVWSWNIFVVANPWFVLNLLKKVHEVWFVEKSLTP